MECKCFKIIPPNNKMDLIVLNTILEGKPVQPEEGSWYSPSSIEYYDNVIIKEISLLSETEQHTWIVSNDNIEYILSECLRVLFNYKLIVGHNILLHINVIASQLYRLQHLSSALEFTGIEVECTMYLGSLLTKSDKLTVNELYSRIFSLDVVESMDSLNTCKMVYDCYAFLKNINIDKIYIPHVHNTLTKYITNYIGTLL